MLDVRAPNRSTSRGAAMLPRLLDQIDPDVHYGDWLQVLMAIFYVTRGSQEGFDLADAWSSEGKKYRGTHDVHSKWKSFRLNHPRPIRIGTLIRMAKMAA